MANPPTRIPLAYLPRLVDTASLLSLSFGSASLLLLLGLDAWRSKSKKTHLIPGDSFVLGALSLQLLGLLSRPIVNISDSQELNQESVKNLFDLIFSNMFLALSGRVVTCVFIGNMLPDVARSPNRNVWSDMLALAISVTGVLIHLCYEIYILLINYWMSIQHEPSDYWVFWYLSINIIMFVSIVLLVLLLGCAALTSKSIHEVVSHRVPALLSKSEHRKLEAVVWWEAVEEHAVRSWITARTYQPQYIVGRSVVISSIGFLVTICVAFSLAFSSYLWIQVKVFGIQWDILTWLRAIAIAVQGIFILSGWAVVCWRWLMAIVFYPRLMGKEGLSLRKYFRVEDFWKRSMLELQEEFFEWNLESMKSLSFLNKFLLMSIQKLRFYKLLPVLIHLQILLVLMSKTCWLISEMLFSNHYMRRILMGPVSHEFSVLYNLYNNGGLVGPGNHGSFVKYLDALMHMPGENPAGVWIANLKSIQEMKARMTEGESHGKNCKALISLLEKKTMQRSTDPFAFSQRKLQVENDFDTGKSSAKMTAFSLLTIIIELSAFYREYGRSSASATTDTVEICIEACSEAWAIMELVENSDPEISLVSKQAGRLFHSLKKFHKWLGLSLPINNFEARTVEAAKEALQGLSDMGKQMANDGCISSTGYDSKNWKAVIAGNNLYNVCESIKNRSDDIDEMLDIIERSLADVIGSCIFKVEEIIVHQCSLWAETFMEEKLLDVFYEGWRAKGVIQQLRPGIRFGRPSIFQYERTHSF